MIRLPPPRAAAAIALAGALAAALAGAAPAGAQLPKFPKLPTRPVVKPLAPGESGGGRAQPSRPGGDASVPAAYRPPPGMCRIWLDSVPASQQPAPTDCASAVRNRPENGRVLFGDDYVNERERPRPTVPPERKPATAAAAEATLPPDTLEGMGPAAAVARTYADARSVLPPRDGLRAHGPNAEEGATTGFDASPEPAQDSTRRAPAPRATPRRDPSTLPPPPAVRGRGRPTEAEEDDYDAGYRAGYEDAMRGRAPRVAGIVVSRGGVVPGADEYAPGAVAAAGGFGGAVIVPPAGDPRYFNNGRFPPPGRANGVCLDRDQDGWCDDPRFGAPTCRDLDGDGRCDDYAAEAAAPYPSALPDMRAADDLQRGRGSATAIRWLGTAEVVARPSGGRAGAPYRILWYDANSNALLQAWTDRDGDGVADRVEIFRNGRRVKLLGR